MAAYDSFDQYSSEERQIDIKQLLFRYLRYWKWFALGVFITLVIAFLYNRYTTSIYQTTAQIKVLKDQENGFSLAGLDGAEPFFASREVNLENEIAILESRKLLDSVVRSLKLGISYFNEGNIKTSEMWKDEVPIAINWVSNIEATQSALFTIKFEPASTTTFKVRGEDAVVSGEINDTITIGEQQFIVELNPTYEGMYSMQGTQYLFSYTSDNKAIDRLKSNLQIDPIGKQSEVLNIVYKGPNRHKNEVILDTLISKFNKDGMRDKQLISKRTEEFVDTRLQALSHELDEVESGLVDYKRSQGAISIESVTQQLFGKESSAEQKRFELETQKAITEDFRDVLINGGDYELLPANLGIESSSINDLTAKYNESVLLRSDLLTSSTPSNPLVVNLESKMDKIRSNILKSVNNHLKSIGISLRSYLSKEEESSDRLSNIPAQEKGERSIRRQQEVKENLYLFLLQKREEAALQYAQTAPSIKVVDYAYTQPKPIAPKKKIIYLAALILGVLIPFGILYLKFLLDTRVSEREDIERDLPNTSILAELPALGKTQERLVVQNDQSILAEAFRVLRTNLNFYSTKEASKAQVIFVTSSIKGEGKTFTAVNLAHSLAATGKRVLIIGADLRNPQTHTYFHLDKSTNYGVSTFLSDKSMGFESLVNKNPGNFKNLDLILSGHIPPNPAELLLNDRFEVLLEEAKSRYDYVIVDTAPTVLVSDTLLIAKFSDVTLYLVRADYTDQKILKHINALQEEKKLNHIGIVLNDVKHSRNGYSYGYGYNYGYGYGYAEDQKEPWWEFWKKWDRR